MKYGTMFIDGNLVRVADGDDKELFLLSSSGYGLLAFVARRTARFTSDQCRDLSRWLADRAGEIEKAKVKK